MNQSYWQFKNGSIGFIPWSFVGTVWVQWNTFRAYDYSLGGYVYYARD